MLEFLRHRWFLFSLIVVLILGIGWPENGKPLVQLLSSNAIVAAVTFIMALPLETSVLWRAVRRPGPAWLAAVINSGVAPPLGWVVSRILPQELAVGVIVAASVPCTLATAAVWTRRAGGNDAIAFLVTMITNLSCFFIVPAWMWLLIGINARLDYPSIVLNLVEFVVMPIIAAQIVRQCRPIGHWATVHKHALSRVAQCGVLLMVFVGAVSCGVQLEVIADRSLLSFGNVATMIIAVVAVHLALLLLGVVAARGFAFDRSDVIAVAFSGSQKTIMVGAFLALAVGPLAILPMVAYHAAQLVIDTLVADRWR